MNVRTILLSIVLVVIFALTVGLVTAQTKEVSDTSSVAANSEGQEPSINLNESYSTVSYRSQFGDCFDVPITDLAGCQNSNQPHTQSDRSTIDVCFDVSIGELASCRKESQAPVP